MENQMTMREYKFAQQCSTVWNTMNVEQRKHYRCLIEFVTAFCEFTHEEFSYNEKCKMLDYIARNDEHSAYEWQKAVSEMEKIINEYRK